MKKGMRGLRQSFLADFKSKMYIPKRTFQKVIDSIRAAIKEDVKKVSNLLEEEEGYMVDEYDEDW